MTTVTWIIVILVLAALAAVAFAMYRKQRTSQLRERFGPEYERVVDSAPSRREAEAHLADVAHRRDRLDVRDLSEAERSRYQQEWDDVQARFVDRPSEAVDRAQTLIVTVLRERGYPVDDFDERSDLIAVDHPDVVQHYREAHAAHQRHRSSTGAPADTDAVLGADSTPGTDAATGSDTEDLRQAFVHYRELFVVLVRGPEPVREAGAGRETEARRTDGADETARPEDTDRGGEVRDLDVRRDADGHGDAGARREVVELRDARPAPGSTPHTDPTTHPQETR